MVELTDTEIEDASRRGRMAYLNEPRGVLAHYDRKEGRIVVELTNGCIFAFPARIGQGLENATDEELAQVELIGRGYGLHWEALDADLSIPGLMAGLFGTKSYMARRAGQQTSPAKAAAARMNGAKGGRPRKSNHG